MHCTLVRAFRVRVLTGVIISDCVFGLGEDITLFGNSVSILEQSKVIRQIIWFWLWFYYDLGSAEMSNWQMIGFVLVLRHSLENRVVIAKKPLRDLRNAPRCKSRFIQQKTYIS